MYPTKTNDLGLVREIVMLSHRGSPLLILHGELLLLDSLELISEVELCGLLLELGEFVLVFGNFLQCRLDAAWIN